jgi:hypothetical protein
MATPIEIRVEQTQRDVCPIPSCGRPRYRFGSWCCRHASRLANQGHPVLSAPTRRYRTALRKRVRPFVVGALTRSRELRTWLEGVRLQLDHWAGSEVLSWRVRGLCEHVAAQNTTDLLTALVSWAVYERELRDTHDPLPRWWSGRPERVERFRRRQLAYWLRGALGWGTADVAGSGKTGATSWRRVAELLTSHYFPGGRMASVTNELARAIAPHVREEMEVEDERRRAAALAEYDDLQRRTDPKTGRVEIYE